MNSIIVVSCLLAVAVANPMGHLPLVPVAAIGHISNPNYNFNYAVNDPHTGDNKAQWESRHGDVVKGEYSLVEPDGSIRVVEYAADGLHGFNAVVKKIGGNVHSVAPVAHAVAHGPIAHHNIAYGPIAHHAIAHGPIPLAHGPIPLAHGPILHTPIIAHEPIYPLLPYWPKPEPWVSVKGYSHGPHGVRHWSAGPISLDGKTLTIRTRH